MKEVRHQKGATLRWTHVASLSYLQPEELTRERKNTWERIAIGRKRRKKSQKNGGRRHSINTDTNEAVTARKGLVIGNIAKKTGNKKAVDRLTVKPALNNYTRERGGKRTEHHKLRERRKKTLPASPMVRNAHSDTKRT